MSVIKMRGSYNELAPDPYADYHEVHFSDSLREYLLGKAKGTSVPHEIVSLFSLLFYEYKADNWGLPHVITNRGKIVAGNYFSLRKINGEAYISFMPAGKEQPVTADGKWARKGRQTIKPSRWLRAFVPDEVLRNYNITDTVLERFANGMKAATDEFQNKYTIEEVSGGAIVYWYGKDRYADRHYCVSSSLHNSCMGYEEEDEDDGDYYEAGCLDFYANAPGCQLIIVTNEDGALEGRALLWHSPYAVVQSPADTDYYNREKNLHIEDVYLMDVQYENGPSIQELMRAYACDNGYYWKSNRDGGFYSPQGEQVRLWGRMMGGKYNAEPYHDTVYPAYTPNKHTSKPYGSYGNSQRQYFYIGSSEDYFEVLTNMGKTGAELDPFDLADDYVPAFPALWFEDPEAAARRQELETQIANGQLMFDLDLASMNTVVEEEPEPEVVPERELVGIIN